MVRLVGLEPRRPAKIGGFKDRCVCQFHHSRKEREWGVSLKLLPVSLCGGPLIYNMGIVCSETTCQTIAEVCNAAASYWRLPGVLRITIF